MLLDGTFKHLGRTREIIRVLMKYGFEDFVMNTPLQSVIPRRMLLNWMRDDRLVYESTRWERVRMACEELGPTFVKAAQILSNRPDLLPDALITELKKLQSEVAPFPFEQAKEIIENELEQPFNLVFDELEEKPLGSASIGQVHKAKLVTGEEVVVKVRRPNVSRIMHQDLDIIKSIVVRAESWLKEQGIINAMDAVVAFEKSMYKELDYLHEARNIESFRKFYKDNRNFYVPKAYKEYSTKRILVTEFAGGCKITDKNTLIEWGLSPEKIAENGMDIYLTQIFEFGYFHADPHPGNIIIKPDGTLCLIDFGMVGKLMKRDKLAFADVFVSMARQDAKSMAMSLKRLSIEDDVEDIRMLEYDLNEIIEDYALLDVTESSIEELIDRLQKVMYDYKMRVPGGVFLIFRALAVLEGIGKQIHPHFNISEFVKPYGLRLLKEQYSPKTIAEDTIFRIGQVMSLLNSIPIELRTILKKTRQGKLHIEVGHKGYEPLLQKIDRVVNRFILSLVIVVLILSSAVAMNADWSESMLFSPLQINFFSLGGLVIAISLSIVLLFAILRTRKP